MVYKVFVMICMLVAIFSMSAFAAEGAPSPQKQPANITAHGNGKESSKTTMVDLLKKQKLANYPTLTIGNAFDNYRYISKINWKELPDTNGKIYIHFSGDIKKKWFGLDKSWDDVGFRQLEVKFVVTPNGDYGVVMASRIDYKKLGGVEKVPIADLKGLLDSIYTNKEIAF